MPTTREMIFRSINTSYLMLVCGMTSTRYYNDRSKRLIFNTHFTIVQIIRANPAQYPLHATAHYSLWQPPGPPQVCLLSNITDNLILVPCLGDVFLACPVLMTCLLRQHPTETIAISVIMHIYVLAFRIYFSKYGRTSLFYDVP